MTIREVARNDSIPDDVREFLRSEGLSVDQIFPVIEEDLQENDYSDTRRAVNLIKSIDQTSTAQKVLFTSFIINLRQEVKKIQAQVADISRMMEKMSRDIQRDISRLEGQNTDLVGKINSKIDALVQLSKFPRN